jgi:hypothetical protein
MLCVASARPLLCLLPSIGCAVIAPYRVTVTNRARSRTEITLVNAGGCMRCSPHSRQCQAIAAQLIIGARITFNFDVDR